VWQRVEEVSAAPGQGMELAHGWMLYALEPPSMAEAAAVLRDPAQAVPAVLARRLGALRLLAVPYLKCGGDAEYVTGQPPEGDTHSSLWLERPDGPDLFLSFGDGAAHDTGFELLAAVADLLVRYISGWEFTEYLRLIQNELDSGVPGEIDEDSLAAKRAGEPGYVTASLAATLSEYMHALWHDVEVRSGPDHLPAEHVRLRLELLQRLFPPNPGSTLFRPALDDDHQIR